MEIAVRDLDLNSGQPPFEAHDAHIASSDAPNPNTALGINLNEDGSSEPSLPTVEYEGNTKNNDRHEHGSPKPSLATMEYEGNSNIHNGSSKPSLSTAEYDGNSNIDRHEHGQSESYDPLLGVEKMKSGSSFLQGTGVSVVGSAEVGDDVVNGGGKEDVQPHLGLDSADVALESNGDVGILCGDAAKEDGLSSEVIPMENPNVNPLEEAFDKHPVKNSCALHETSNENSKVNTLEEAFDKHPVQISCALHETSNENSKVNTLEEDFDKHPVKNSCALHETSNQNSKVNTLEEAFDKYPVKNSCALHETSNENSKVNTLEEAFDKHPGKNSCALHETSNAIDNSRGHPQEEGDCTSTELGISVGNLVWGKVKYHPWWPGQVFDPSDASELARQHQKKDRLLVAYFGDETFAWVDKFNLKHFQENFAELSKQSTGKAFGKAVEQAVDELARRVQIGLACACLSDQTCIRLENKAISSVGLCKGALVAKDHRDVTTFDPQKLLTCVQELAKYPSTENTLEIAMFLAQISVFYALHRHSIFGKSSSEALLQDESGFASGTVSKSTPSTPKHVKIINDFPPKQTRSSSKKQSLKKRKRLFEDSEGYDVFEDEELPIKNKIETPKRGVKKSAESVSARKASLSASKKPRTNEHVFASGSDSYLKGSKTHHVKKIGSPRSGDANVGTKKKAFKLGECISKIASQLTGSPPIIKSVDPKAEDTPEQDAADTTDEEYILRSPSSFSKSPLLVMEDFSIKEMLLELFQVAQNPVQRLEENDIFSRVTSVFLKFRDEVFQKDCVYPSYRRSSRSSSKLAATSYMDDDSDDTSYIDKKTASKRKGHSPGRSLKRKAESQGRESTKKSKHRSILSNSTSSKKVKKLEDPIKFPDSISSRGAPLSNADDLKDPSEKSLTALFMTFPPGLALPTELELKEIFGSFGQIAEIQFFSDSGCAQVIFRRCSDAEAAFHGATANKVFSPATVSFRLRYLSSRTKTQNDDLRKDEMTVMSEDRNP